MSEERELADLGWRDMLPLCSWCEEQWGEYNNKGTCFAHGGSDARRGCGISDPELGERRPCLSNLSTAAVAALRGTGEAS